MNNSKLKVFNWCFSIFCITSLLVYGLCFGTIIMCLIGIFSMPIEKIQSWWDELPFKGKWVKPVLLSILFFAAIMILPDTAVDESQNNTNIIADNSEISSEKNSDEDGNNAIKPTATAGEESVSGTNSPTNSVAKTKEPVSTDKGTGSNSSNAGSSSNNGASGSSNSSATSQGNAAGGSASGSSNTGSSSTGTSNKTSVKLEDIPKYSGKPYVVINGNVPFFKDSELTTKSYEYYSPLDSLGRCGVVHASVGKDIMPTEERGSIGQVKPTGWHSVKYDCVDGKYLYNRCHLIGYQLTGENANTKNLITGTRSMNVDGMLPFENMVQDYVVETGNNVMYRVTPYFKGNNLLANGVLMEAKSVQDDGDGILFNVFVYNVQDGVNINYATGDSSLASGAASGSSGSSSNSGGSSSSSSGSSSNSSSSSGSGSTSSGSSQNSGSGEVEVQSTAKYILNTNSKKFHYPSCSSADDIKASNREEYNGTREDLISDGYDACKRCNP